MTTTSVKDVGSVMNLGAAAAAGSPAGKTGGASFQDVWSSQAERGRNAEQPAADRKQGSSFKTEQPDRAPKPGENFKGTERSAVRAGREEPQDETDGLKDSGEIPEEELERAMEIAAGAAAELIQQISDTFQIPVEEVQELMDSLELEPADLLKPENLSSLLLEAGGAQDSLALLTDEKLFSDFQTLMDQGKTVLEETSEKLQMKPEQVLQISSSLRETAAAEYVPEEETAVETVPQKTQQEPVNGAFVKTEIEAEQTGPADDGLKEKIAGENGPEEHPAEHAAETGETAESVSGELRTETGMQKEDAVQQPVKAEAKTGTVKQEADGGQEIRRQEPQTEESLQTAVRKEETAGGGAAEDKKGSGREHSEHGRPEGNLILQTIRNDEFQPRMEEVQETARTWNADTQNIMQQIMDYMRIQVRADVSSLEMQLHPASLGMLQIQVASKGGVLTANFIAQNETVKTALESQMTQLRESFEQQGVKVEAIEVTVQTRQFDQNLEQGRGRQPQESGERRSRIRRIRLDGMEGSERLEEADRLTAEMMAADGSTVDYTA